MAKKLKITQIRSTIKTPKSHKLTIKALGLGKLHKSVIHNDNLCIRGMIYEVRHLVKVEEIDGE